MPRPLSCRVCGSELDPAQEFAYHVELMTADNPAMLAAIRRLPHANGKPLRVCRKCQRNRLMPMPTADRIALRAIAAVGLVAMTATLSRWLVAKAV